MAKKVGICAVAQTTFERDKKDIRFQGMALDVLEALREQVDVTFSRHVKGATGVDMTISVSDDIFDARTISDNAMTDVLGAHFGCEEKVAQEGIQALYYGLAAIASGHNDIVLLMGHCKESQGQSRNMVTHVAFDPFFTRPVGLDFCATAGLQAQAYADKSGITDEQLAKIVVRARENASKNPYTPDIGKVSAEEVMASSMLTDPIRELHAYPVSDGAVGMILATEDVARKICDNPIWITGVGNCMDSFFLGDRDLTSNFALKKACERAYKRAGITDPKSAFDVIELSDQYAYQLPMWAEGIGICDEGKGADWLDADGPVKQNVNTSGGMLAGNPLILGGLVRAAEAAFQLRGECGDRQVENAKTAIAHGVMGPAGQFHSVITLARD
ncbi:MAG: thiolase family protein [Desulfobacteraceae bacterium]|jgi:acetyl-CoA C-acetyltransferase|nr:thiolase family protein [Desulfobacteraceae bacterium]